MPTRKQPPTCSANILYRVLSPGSLISIQLKRADLAPSVLEILKQYVWLPSLCPPLCLDRRFICLRQTLLTGHWGGPYGGVTAQGSWLSGGGRRKPDKGSAGRPSASHSLNGAMADPPPKRLACTFFESWIYGKTGHFNIIRSAIHTPALRVTWSFFMRLWRNVFFGMWPFFSCL